MKILSREYFPLYGSLLCVVGNVTVYVHSDCTVQWLCVCTHMFIIGISASGCPHLDLSRLVLLSSLFVHINCTYMCILYVSPSPSGVQVLPKSALYHEMYICTDAYNVTTRPHMHS